LPISIASSWARIRICVTDAREAYTLREHIGLVRSAVLARAADGGSAD